MSNTIKIVIPMAGFGSRLRPHTWSRPKQLISIAGKSVLSHVLDTFSTLPNQSSPEFIFIVGYLGDKIKTYMDETYPDLKVSYVIQDEMRGQSHAIYLAKEYLEGPMLMVFADTLIETNLSFLAAEPYDVVGWVKSIEDPRRFGVAKTSNGDEVTQLVEKPTDKTHNLAVVGFYYFKDSEKLIEAIDTQMEEGIQLKGEFFLADAINIMLGNGARMRVERINTWLDAGTPDAVLETNRYLLEHGKDNSSESAAREDVRIIPPVFIHPNAEISSSIIGPYASIGTGCTVENSIVQNSILENGCKVVHSNLDESLIGENAVVTGNSTSINVGDNSSLKL